MDVGPGVGYAVVAALVWGGYLFALKRYFDLPSSVLAVVANAFGLAWYLPVAALTLPPSEAPDPRTVPASAAAFAAGVAVVTAVAVVLSLRAIDAGDVSYVAPINKTAPVFVLPVEVGLLGARLTPLEVTGVLVATGAVYVANYRSGSLLAPFRLAARNRAARWALVSAALYGVSDVGKRVVLQELGLPPQVWVPVLYAGMTLTLLPFAVRAWPADGVRGDLPKLAALGGVAVFGEHVTSLAFAAVPASVASPIINTQAVVAVVLGGVVLREGFLGRRLAASGLAVAGVALIAV